MCGIAGIFNPNGLNDLKESSSPIREMVSALYHRGPDEQGVLISKIAHLGHARLSIVDIENGQQPMLSENNRFAITYNGEIYNHFELRNALLKKGYRFKTKCDTEVLLYLYQEYQEKCVPMLNGQFAFVAVKENDNRILIARDPLGIAPLYYGVDESDNLWVSSELKAIHNKVKVPMEFPPGCCLTTNNINDIYRYYRPNWWGGELPNSWKFNKSHIELVKKDIEDKLTVSVKKRMMSDVPFGILLSGGLDSSIIASIAIKNVMNPGKIKTFSIVIVSNNIKSNDFFNLIIF